MKINNPITLALAVVVISTASGCASYRTTSNISTPSDISYSGSVIITQGVLSGQEYTETSPIEVSVKKLTAFNADPTKEQANAVLKEKARVIGADAVINVTYKSGVGMTTWGYIDAKGMGVKTNE